MSSNDSGLRIVELDEETLKFALHNCETNLHQGMGVLQLIHDGKFPDPSGNFGRKIVGLIESFRKLKAGLEKAK